MTGVEAVSNGVKAFSEPTSANAQRTLTVIIATLMVLLAGISYLTSSYGVGATDPVQHYGSRPIQPSPISHACAALSPLTVICPGRLPQLDAASCIHRAFLCWPP